MFVRKTRRSDERHRHEEEREAKNANFRVAPYRLSSSKKLHIYCHTQPASTQRKNTRKKNRQQQMWMEKKANILR